MPPSLRDCPEVLPGLPGWGVAVSQNLELFGSSPTGAPCSLCRSLPLNSYCPRCEQRSRLTPPGPSSRSRRAGSPSSTLELFAEVESLPPCSRCGALGFNPACWRCDTRRSLAAHRLTDADRAAIREDVLAELAQREAVRRARLARLAALGRPVHVVLVACGKKKRAEKSPARLLYTSALSRRSIQYAEAFGDECFIVSALHGLLTPEEEVEPYEFRLTQLRLREREGWGRRIAQRLTDLYGDLPVRVTFLAGKSYERWVSACLPKSWELAYPLTGLGLGPRVQWLKAELHARGHSTPARAPEGEPPPEGVRRAA